MSNISNSYSAIMSNDTLFLEHILNILNKLNVDQQFTIKEISFDTENCSETIKLYEFNSREIAFIIKVGKKNNQDILDVKNFVESKYPELKNFLILPIIIGSYTEDQKNINYHYQIMIKAPGRSVGELFSDYLAGQMDANYLNNCYFKIGKTIAKLHQNGSIDHSLPNLSEVKTYLLHNDLHEDNIFYDGNTIYIIDNAEISQNINNSSSIDKDLKTILLQTTHLPCLFIHSQLTDTQRKEIADFTKSFLQGYISELQNVKYSEYLSDIVKKTIDTVYNSAQTDSESSVFLDPEERLAITLNIIGESIETGYGAYNQQ